MNATEIRNEVKGKIQQSINQLETALAAQVMDGSPFLITIERDGLTMVFGEWDGQRGFKVGDVIPNHLCGTVQMSPDAARANVAKLNANGEKAKAIHWREFIKARLQAERALLAGLLGGEAFAAGVMRAPAMDPAINPLLAGNQVGEGAEVLSAWLRAWDAANLADQKTDADFVAKLPHYKTAKHAGAFVGIVTVNVGRMKALIRRIGGAEAVVPVSELSEFCL